MVAFIQATRYTHTHTFSHRTPTIDQLTISATQDDSAQDSDAGAHLCSVYVCLLQLSGSMMSLFSSGDFGTVEVRGRIQYSLVYDNHSEELQVKVYRCEDIASARKNRSDP